MEEARKKNLDCFVAAAANGTEITRGNASHPPTAAAITRTTAATTSPAVIFNLEKPLTAFKNSPRERKARVRFHCPSAHAARSSQARLGARRLAPERASSVGRRRGSRWLVISTRTSKYSLSRWG